MSDKDEDEMELWAHVTKGVQPLKGRDKISLNYKKSGKARQIDRTSEISDFAGIMVPSATPQLKEHDRSLDRRTKEKLRRGQMKIEASLDLHGMSRLQAHEALESFILRSHSHGMRTVLVITGKGAENKGILRQEVPRWLYEGALSPVVLQHYLSKGKHGGDGALYVLLRRSR